MCLGAGPFARRVCGNEIFRGFNRDHFSRGVVYWIIFPILALRRMKEL
jgi:hypothetical protein